MDIFIMTLFIVICLLLIMVILLQKGRGGGLGAMFGGAGSSAFGTRTGDVFTWVTVVLTAMFLLMAIGTTLIFRPKPQTVDVPVFMPPGRSTDDMTSVSIRCETDKAEIYYTLNETEPTENSKQYTRVPVQVRSAETLKAKAFRRGYLPSPTAVWPAKVTPETAPATSEPAQPNNQD